MSSTSSSEAVQSILRLNTVQRSAPMKMAWKVGLACGRAYELLRADLQDHVRHIQQEIGYRYCRFHGLFHDDMSVVVRDADGQLRFQWGHVDKVFDFLLSVGLTPFVELNPMPRALASGEQTFFFYRMNVTPPRDYAEWELLVEEFARHCIRRYGSAEVRKWYFEVWNEPNLSAFWSGSQEDYWKLYDASYRAIKSVDPALRVGGPASAEGGWIEDFLTHTQAQGTGADFVSSHVYPMNEFGLYEDRTESPYTPGRFFPDRVKRMGERSKQAGLPFFLTEWNVLDSDSRETVDWLDNPTIDGIYGAALAAMSGVELDDACEGLFWWVASDIFEEAGMPQSPFSGTYGMLTIDGLPKPAFHVFRLLKRMTGERLSLLGEDLPDGCGAVAAVDQDITQIMLYNHVPVGLPQREWSGTVHLPLEGNVPQSAKRTATKQHIRPGAGSAFETWVAMGRPQNLSPAQFDLIKAHATPQADCELADGPISIDFSLKPGEILYVEIAPAPDSRITKELLSEQAANWNAALADIPTDGGTQ